jgi:hypothetical protein
LIEGNTVRHQDGEQGKQIDDAEREHALFGLHIIIGF